MSFLKRAGVFRLGLLVLILMLVSQQVSAQSTALSTPPPTNTPRSSNSSGGQSPATNTPKAAAPEATDSGPTLVPSRTLPPSKTPTNTRTPSNTPTPSPTRTPSRTPTLPPTMVILGTYETPIVTPITPIPPSAPTPVASGDDIVTVLLLGSDTITPDAVARTDVIIVLVIDRTANTVAMLHFPRDMIVYAPNGSPAMAKINTIMNTGNVKYGPGGGAKLIKDTLLYNFGIKIDFYARVDFVQFQNLINKLGGLDISVDCAIQGNRLKSPDMDVTKPESYELYTLPVGYQHLGAYMSLWYVRSRGSSNDFKRGERQLDVLRAMWRQAKNAGLFAQITQLWPEVQKLVETDMTLQDIVGLAPIALNIDPEGIQRINVSQETHFTQWYTSDVGSFGLLPKPDVWKTTIQNLVLPPPKNRLGGESPTVEVAAALPVKGYDHVAADRLSWEGFTAKAIGTEGAVNRTNTVIIDYTGNAKPSSRASLMKLLRVSKAAVIDKPDPNRTVDFRVEMGKDYGQCIWALAPQYQDSPTPQP
ncbi:MAG: LCP family protein [Chloroflexota bacterium]